MNKVDLNNLRIDGLGPGPIPKAAPQSFIPRRGERFLKGPIPMDWITKAARIKGKALHVGIMLWYLSGLKRSMTVRLSNGLAKSFDFDRTTKLRSLKALERSGLITVVQKPGRSPLVTILDCKENNHRTENQN